MELQDWRKEPRKNYSNEFKLRMVELASQPGACVAQIARENGVNDNVIFKWLRLWQNEGRVSRLDWPPESPDNQYHLNK
ncbi:transposase [Escherichia coli]|nr:transposase [Escherichia coli]